MKMLALLFSLFCSSAARATLFDAADILPQNSGAVSAMGEIILTDPSSEGIEAHARYGISDEWNVGAIVGTGTKEKNFRMGGQGVFNLFPDYEGQLGVSFVGTLLYLNRYGSGGLQTQVGPMIHKRISSSWLSLPANLHAGFLWQLEARSGGSASGTQFVVGSDFDIAGAKSTYMSTELGINLARTDSYILVGVGLRLGDLTFNAKKKGEANSTRSQDSKSTPSQPDYTDADFKK